MAGGTELSQIPEDILNRIPAPLFLAERDFVIYFWNRAAEQLLGWAQEEVLGKGLPGLSPPDFDRLMHLMVRLPECAPSPVELTCLTKSHGHLRVRVLLNEWVPSKLGDRPLVCVLLDVIDFRPEERLQKNLIMDAVGRLAGGIAHDFNNLLNNIEGYARLILSRHEKDLSAGELDDITAIFDFAVAKHETGSDPLNRRVTTTMQDADYKDAELIVNQANRGAVLTNQLNNISGRTRPRQNASVDLREFFNATAARFRNLLIDRADLHLDIAISEELGYVHFDAFELEQVLVHLLQNARDAMEGAGTIRIRAASVTDAESAQGVFDNASDRLLAISVTDSGAGIDSSVLARIFEPFNSTKRGRSGLSLTLAYHIVKRYGGEIFVETTSSQGTTFTVHLHRLAQSHGGATGPASRAVDFRGTETILLVEDKVAMRQLIATTLRDRGYNVLVATSADEALTVHRLDPVSIQLLLTDVVMPGGSGREVGDNLKLIRPNLKTLFMSGRLRDELEHEGLLPPGADFIQKPWTAEALARKVRQILDATA